MMDTTYTPATKIRMGGDKSGKPWLPLDRFLWHSEHGLIDENVLCVFISFIQEDEPTDILYTATHAHLQEETASAIGGLLAA